MRRGFTTRAAAMSAAAALALAACGDDTDDQQAAPEGEEQDLEDLDEGELEDLLGEQEGMEDLADPSEDIEDGVYRGNGVLLPVPDGWSIEPTALQQGVVAAISEDQEQYFSAQAIDIDEAEAAGQDMDFETVLDQIRDQFGDNTEVDEEVELAGAERAHRLTLTDLPPPQEGMPEQHATIVFAEDGQGLMGQFEFAASVDEYDEDMESVLLASAGFDPDSEPPAMPQQPQPAPEEEMSPEDMEEMEDMFDDEG